MGRHSRYDAARGRRAPQGTALFAAPVSLAAAWYLGRAALDFAGISGGGPAVWAFTAAATVGTLAALTLLVAVVARWVSSYIGPLGRRLPGGGRRRR